MPCKFIIMCYECVLIDIALIASARIKKYISAYLSPKIGSFFITKYFYYVSITDGSLSK